MGTIHTCNMTMKAHVEPVRSRSACWHWYAYRIVPREKMLSMGAKSVLKMKPLV